MTLTLPVRALAFSAATAILAAALVTLPATPLAPSDSAAADNPTCLPGYFDVGNLINPPHQETDPDVGTYVAGDLLISTGASEMEGTFVIGDNATFNSGAYFNVGTVGAGSQYVPAYGSDMLTVGGNLTIPSAFDVEVGNLAGPAGGNVVVGGSVSAPDIAQLTLNGGSLTQGGGVGVISPYAPVAALYAGLSVELSSLADTGTVSSDANNVYFTSTNADVRQVFTVSGSDLGTLATTKTINLINMPVDAVIIINVTGATAVLSANAFVLNGSTINPNAVEPNRAFSHLTQSMLWNFADATNVTLGRQDQLLGSVLVPTPGATTQLLTSTNGRLYINGDLTLGGGTTETGLEIHNYPFRNCTASASGSLAITKALSDPSGIVDDSRVFTGTYTCTPTVGADITGTWSAMAGATDTISGLPVGASCSILEDALVAPPHSTDTSYVWGTPTYSAAQVIGDGTTVTITATNSFTRATGSFSITKSLSDPDSVVDPDRVFTGTYSCQPLSGPAITGTWSLEAGDTQTSSGFPTGSTCTITEDTLSVAPSADPSYVWGTPSFSPTSVVTGDGTTVAITAVNTVLHNVGSLAITKTLSDVGNIVPDSRVFTGTYSCAPTVGADITGTWSVIVGATQTVTNIPTGAVCTIAEDALVTGPSSDTSYVWGTPTMSPANGTITTGGTVTLTAQNSFSRQTGSLAITKSLTDPDGVVATDREFTGSYLCDPLSGSDFTGTWSVEVGDTDTFSGIPAGSTCTILEDALSVAPSSDPTYVWGTPTYSPASVVTANGTTVTLTAVNTVLHNVGSLAITKTLTDVGNIVPDNRVFTGTYLCDPTSGADVTGTWSVMVGATQTVTGIPTGAVCTITEDALSTPPSASDVSYVWGTPTYSPANGTITTGGTVTLTAQNSFTRQTGSFSITKALTDPDGVVATDRVFTGTYSCDPQTGPDITGTWSLEAGDTQTSSGIPVGSVCSIIEDPLTDPPISSDLTYVWDAPVYSPSSVTTTGGTVTITATNSVLHGVGTLAITKSLIDADSVVDPSRTFTGTVSCTVGTPSPNTWSITAGGPAATFPNIPAGATCTITEDALTVAPSSTDSSYVWQPVTYSSSNVVVIPLSSAVTVQVNNEVRRGLGNLELIKVLDDPFDVVNLSRVYSGTYECIHNTVDVTQGDGTWSTTAGAAPISLATNLPAGTVCTVAEDDATLAAPPLAGFPQYIWRAPVFTPATIIITDGVTGRFTVTNTVYDPFALLAATGSEVALPLGLGGGVLVLGLVAVIFGNKRRRGFARS